jgi:hypothetical protein
VPQDGPVADLNHRFWLELGLFPESSPKTSAKDDNRDIRIHYSFLSLIRPILYRMTEDRGQRAEGRGQKV